MDYSGRSNEYIIMNIVVVKIERYELEIKGEQFTLSKEEAHELLKQLTDKLK